MHVSNFIIDTAIDDLEWKNPIDFRANRKKTNGRWRPFSENMIKKLVHTIRLLNHSPSYWVNILGQECAMAAAVNLQRDAGLMMTNLQILAQFVTSLHRMSSEMLSIGVDHVVFPVEEVEKLSRMPRAQRAAKYMTAMGLWRPPSGLGAPGPLPVYLAQMS